MITWLCDEFSYFFIDIYAVMRINLYSLTIIYDILLNCVNVSYCGDVAQLVRAGRS